MSEFEQKLRELKQTQEEAEKAAQLIKDKQNQIREAAENRIKEKRGVEKEKVTTFCNKILLPILEDIKRVFAPKDGKVAMTLTPTYDNTDTDSQMAGDSHTGYVARIELLWDKHTWSSQKDEYSSHKSLGFAVCRLTENFSVSLFAGKNEEITNAPVSKDDIEEKVKEIKIKVLELIKNPETCTVVQQTFDFEEFARIP